MAIQKVSGSTIGLVAAVPVIPPTPTNPQIIAGYDAQAYVVPTGCIITTLVQPQRDWNTNQDPVTTCDDNGAMRQSFKTDRVAANGTIGFLMDYDEAFLELGYALQASDVDVCTYEITHRSGERVWAQGQIKTFTVDTTDNEGRLQGSFEFIYNAWPEFEGFLN